VKRPQFSELIDFFVDAKKFLDKGIFVQSLLSSQENETDFSLLNLAVLVWKGELEKISSQWENYLPLINTPSHERITPLWVACQNGQIEVVKFLLQNGADPNISNNFGCTPLIIACFEGHFEICSLLLENSDINAQLTDGNTALHLAVEKNNLEMVNFILGVKNILVDKQNGRCAPIHLACLKNKIEIVGMLIRAGADVNVLQETYGNTPLQIAIYNSFNSLIEFLLDNGADPNFFDGEQTPLYMATLYKNTKVVSLLIKRGANVNLRNSDGTTALQGACWGGIVEIFKILVENGADIFNQNESGNTILFDACFGGNMEICKYLIENGVDPLAENKKGKICSVRGFTSSLETKEVQAYISAAQEKERIMRQIPSLCTEFLPVVEQAVNLYGRREVQKEVLRKLGERVEECREKEQNLKKLVADFLADSSALIKKCDDLVDNLDTKMGGKADD